MKYGSLFSGIEAATLAFGPLGWEAQWFSEIDPFCCDLLKQKYPNVPNLGDITNPDFTNLAEPVDLIIGGSPCQSFSLAGKMGGMDDPRGKLVVRYSEVLDIMKPKWFIWENVPGVLSSNNGKDFEVILNEMVKSGYSVVWRVLDARCFGLPQSRNRLYVVGRLGTECPTEVLVESEDNQDPFAEYEKWEEGNSRKYQKLDGVPFCLRGRSCGVVMEFMDYFGCLRANTTIGSNFVWDGSSVRKLTPLECERLQGMPDNYTQLGQSTPDDLRCKSIGNSMAVPVVRWIGRRIQAAENKNLVS